jgi:hypothetical protein
VTEKDRAGAAAKNGARMAYAAVRRTPMRFFQSPIFIFFSSPVFSYLVRKRDWLAASRDLAWSQVRPLAMPPLSELMKLLNLFRLSSLAAAVAAAGWTQTQIDLRTQAKSVNFSTASSTMPSQTGAVLPLNCQVGATFILTTSLAGQNWYICTSANQWTLQGTILPSQTGNGGTVLFTDGTSLHWSAFGGDISGAPTAVSVNKLLGRNLNTVAPAAGQFLGWDGTQWTPQTLSLTSPVTSVFGRTGAISAQTGDYSFAQLSGTVLGTQLPSTGGDLAGAITSATVTRLQTRAVSASAPSTGQVLTWNGTQWAPQNATGGVGSVFGRTGAIVSQTGDYTAAQITNAVDSTRANSYLAGARQTFNPSVNGAGLQVAPGPLPTTPLVGDVAVDSGDSNRIKIYSGSSWVSLNPSVAAGNFTAFFTNASVVSVPGSTHNLATGNLIVECYDNASPSNMVEPSQITVDPTTYNVTVTFAAAETGRCVLNGYSGSGSSNGLGGGAGMAAQLGDFAVVWNSTSTLSIGANCSAATPCNVRFGTQVYSVTGAASATISAGTGVAYIYVDATGALNVGSALTLSCSGCVSTPNVTSFPVNTVPIYSWTAVNGAWDPSGGSDRRGWLNANPVLGGAGIASVTTAGQTTISVDSAVVPTYLTASATLTFPAIAAGTCGADLTFSLPGANPGDTLAPGWPSSLAAGLYGTMRVSASGVVSVRLCADSTGPITPAPSTYSATVVRGF